ncbi:hypothetical protein [Nodularia sp. NIES-3585]|uniref:hypothetical protein n=1 Tax=Nodularia sp. NIES-3585 TaxID=1973477 RepID=UPI000B5C2719|nr:hypothetical protein [Nodularia sp. NIES-3585]GAX38819.1 hypothetical protein NIES3585_48710 [Nodularia sp. NIES-3585]
MRYLNNVKFLNKIETGVEIAIFFTLFFAAIIKFDVDTTQALFYIILAVIISPFSKIEKGIKRPLLLIGFASGVFLGYF